MKKRIGIISVLAVLLLLICISVGAEEPKVLTKGSYYTPAQNDYYITENKLTAFPNTVEAWICVDETISDYNRNGVICGSYDGKTGAAFNVEVFSGKHPRVLLVADNGEAQSYVFNKIQLNSGDFVHLTVIRDVENGEMLCYVDGAFVQSLPLYGSQVITMNDVVGIGGDMRDGNGTYFKGEINSVVLFSDVRTPEEIEVDMNTVVAGAEGLVANWSFDTFTVGQEIVDDQGGAYTLVRNTDWFDNYDVGEYAYTLAVVGDTQHLNDRHPENFSKLYQWLVDNAGADKKNIKAVLGLGDITQEGREDEFQRAQDATALLGNANIPYTMIVGNHDYFGNSTDRFEQYFPIANFNDNSFWGGSYEEDSIVNSYYFLTAGEVEYLIFALEYGPRDAVMEWAGDIIADNQDKNVIITTHAYIWHDGEYIVPGNSGSSPAMSKLYGYNDGDDIWDKLVSKYANISMIISGHVSGDVSVRQKTGVNGNQVTELICDPSALDKNADYPDGVGMVLLLHFSEDGKNVTTEYYSTIKEQYYKRQYQMSFDIDTVE